MKDTWTIRRFIPAGRKGYKWGIWRNGVHVGSERTRQDAGKVVRDWHKEGGVE